MTIKRVVGAMIAYVIRLTIAVAAIYYVYTFSIEAYYVGYRVFSDAAVSIAPGVDYQVIITDDMSKYDIARTLEDIGVIADWRVFWIQLKLSEYKDDIGGGVYALNNSMTGEEVITALAGDAAISDEDDEDVTIKSNTEVQTEFLDEDTDFADELNDGESEDEEDAEADGEESEEDAAE